MSWRSMITGKRLGQGGDTIVEVLICILIVSLILTGAYVTTNRSTLAVRDSQEHAEALKLLQSQLEQLRASASTKNSPIFSAGTPFCMVGATPVSATQQPNAAKCVQDGTGQPTTGSPAFKVTITRTDSAASAVFQARADWDSITGTSKTSEQLSYRLYK